MTDGPAATGAGPRISSGAGRLVKAWRALPRERRLAAYASIGLFLSLFLPWYQQQFFAVIGGRLEPASASQTGWGAFSFVEAAVLVVAAGVLTLLFQRAEGRAFHIPGGDGWAITIAGLWTCVLVTWRIFDKQGGTAHGQNATTYGIEWGIFVALAVGALLAYAGSRIRAAHQPEPPLPGEAEARGASPGAREAGAAVPRGSGKPAPREPPARAQPKQRETRRAQSERTVGWLTAPSRERAPAPQRAPSRPGQSDEQLTIPLEQEE